MRLLKRDIMIKSVVALVLMHATLMLTAVVPAFAQQRDEIAVTGVIHYAALGAGGMPLGKAGGNGTPSYGITDESTQGSSSSPVGYVLEGDYLGGDYSPYLGKRVTVYGTPGQEAEMRVLYVSRLKEQPQ
jgi:hypothetical protein